MSIQTPGDDLACDHCDRPGIPYEYRGKTVSGLTANLGERLCPNCRDAVVAADGVNILVVNRTGTAAWVTNTVADRELIAVGNPEGIDGRDLARHTRKRAKR